jgi:hypothetical protein
MASTTGRSRHLTPEERSAVANELLLQQHQFRQNQAMLHGLPMPGAPLQIQPTPNPPPVDEEEIIRRRREMVAMERVAEAAEAAANKEPDHATAEAVDKVAEVVGRVADKEPDCSTADAVEGVAKEIQNAAARAAEANERIANEAAERAKADAEALRKQLEEERQAWQDERQREADRQEREREAAREERERDREAGLRRDIIRGSSPPPPGTTAPPQADPGGEPAPKKGLSGWKKVAAISALVASGAGLTGAGVGAWNMTRPTPPSETLHILGNLGANQPPTDLGNDIERAFADDPVFRRQFLEEVRRRTGEPDGPRPANQ